MLLSKPQYFKAESFCSYKRRKFVGQNKVKISKLHSQNLSFWVKKMVALVTNQCKDFFVEGYCPRVSTVSSRQFLKSSHSFGANCTLKS